MPKKYKGMCLVCGGRAEVKYGGTNLHMSCLSDDCNASYSVGNNKVMQDKLGLSDEAIQELSHI